VSAERRGAGRWRSAAPEDTARFGESLAPLLEIGDVVALTGPLGAGKTCFVAGLARGLSVQARVRSPSFTLINEYHGRVLLVHLDLYRLEPPEAERLGLDEELERGAVVVEWGEKLPAPLRAQALAVEFALAGERGRELRVGAAGGRGRLLFEGWRARWPAEPDGGGA
jgi:tRNA threonylcarbamoyladenosine biosynthesis protein TsaE